MWASWSVCTQTKRTANSPGGSLLGPLSHIWSLEMSPVWYMTVVSHGDIG